MQIWYYIPDLDATVELGSFFKYTFDSNARKRLSTNALVSAYTKNANKQSIS